MEASRITESKESQSSLQLFLQVFEIFATFWKRYTERIVFTILAFSQAGTIITTWKLWDNRVTPPLLPVFDSLPSFSLGIPLLLSLLFALFKRREGVSIHLCVLFYATLLDQTRLQPEFISIALLLAAIAFPSARSVGRAHLVTLWVWAGVHKFLSLGYSTGGAVFISDSLGLSVTFVEWVVPFTEVLLGIFAVFRRSRYIAIALSFIVHAFILLTLLNKNWNSAVWLWNFSIPFAASFFLLRNKEKGLLDTIQSIGLRTKTAKLMLTIWIFAWLYPAGFYFGISDAYLAHNLYSSNTQQARICSISTVGIDNKGSDCSTPFRSTWESVNVPLPPESRLFKQWFEITCVEGEILVISPIQTQITNYQEQKFFCLSMPKSK